MPRSRLVLTSFLALALVAGVFTAPPSAGQDKKKKPIDSCSLITIEELEVVFEQPFRAGVQETGGSCLFRRPSDSEDPDIIVTVLARRWKTVKKAKQVFVEVSNVTTQLSGEITRVPTLGDQAFSTVLIGADLLTIRVNRVVVDLRVDQNNDTEARFPEQILAVGQVVVTHLAAA